MAVNPYGVTIASPGQTLLPARVTDMQNLHMGWLRYQVHWANIEIQQSPVVYNWAKLDDAVSKCNAAGIKVVFPIQTGPTWAQTAWTQVTVPGALSAIGQTVPAYLNNGADVWQVVLGGTFSAGSQAMLESSADGFTWTPIQTITSAGTYWGVATGLVFLQARCLALHSGDSIAVTINATEQTKSNSNTITATNATAFAHLGNNTIWWEFAFTGTFSSGSHLVIENSTDNSTWSFVQDVFGPGPQTIFGVNSISPVFMRARRISLQTGDSINVNIIGTGPSPTNKLYLNASNTLAFAQAVAHRYTVGDPANVNGMHIEAIEIYNEGADDNNDPLVKSPYYMVQAMQLVYPAIKAINPTMLVGAGAHLQLTDAHIQSWQQAFYLYGGGPYSDYTNLHYYPGNSDPSQIVSGQSADVTFDQYWGHVHAIDVANGYGSKKIRVTEFGWTHDSFDDYDFDTSGNYTSNSNLNSLGTWTWDTANGRITGTGGTEAILEYTPSGKNKFQQGYIEAVLDTADSAGVVMRWVDVNNSYRVEVWDASATTGTPNTLAFIYRKAGVETVVATASISFTRGTQHLVHLEAQGHTPINPYTSVTVQFDGVTVLSLQDSSGPQSGGLGALYQSGSVGGRFYSLHINQDGQVTLQQQRQFTRYVLDSARNSGVVEAVFLFTLDNGNGYSPLKAQKGVTTYFPMYYEWLAYAAFYPTWPGAQEFIIVNARGRDNSIMVARRDEVATTKRRDNSISTKRRANVVTATRRANVATAVRRDNIATTKVRS